MIDAWGKNGNKGMKGIADGDLRGVSRCNTSLKEKWIPKMLIREMC